ncbi:MAG: DUF3793 family protein [Eubacteriales bacterium]|nr:DUF3793 family protein [Eubacteriales bacterium]
MSQKAFRLLLELDGAHLPVRLALQCAPLLAGIKVSNLLIIPLADWCNLCRMLKGSGICVRALYGSGEKITLLLYRREALEGWLNRREVGSLMALLGYESLELHSIFRKLEQKIGGHGRGEMPFPHELGLLLGYPAEDVLGFMGMGQGKCLYTGYWKVYAGLKEKLRLFAEYDRATDAALAMAHRGENVLELGRFFERKSCRTALG